MRIAVAIMLVLLTASSLSAQVIRGSVCDAGSGRPVSYAVVYFSGTSTGTDTGSDGSFTLDIRENGLLPLTVSALGYYSVTLPTYSLTEPLKILLEPKVFELDEVVVREKSNPALRRHYMSIFRTEFLGSSLNASSCVITNEEDIMFSHDRKSGTMTAFSYNPIVILNVRLGYRITYYLDLFEYNRASQYMKLIGNYIFSEDLLATLAEKNRYANRRDLAYTGSRMHFFRALYNNTLDSAGFVVSGPDRQNIDAPAVVTPGDGHGVKYLVSRSDLFISYYALWNETHLIMSKDSVLFDSKGFFDPLGIRWEGEMAKQRIGDLLPFDYTPKEKR